MRSFAARASLFMIAGFLSACSAFDVHDDGGDAGGTGDAASMDVSPDAGTDASDAATAPITCALLGSDCGANHACYPYPFESDMPTGTLCGVQGDGFEQIPCASQLDCNAQSLCISPGQAGATCLTRCDPGFPFCSVGQVCSPLQKYPGVGVCLSTF